MGQPGNIVVNKLQRSMFWFSGNFYNKKNWVYSLLNYKNITVFIFLIFKVGLVYTKHLFYHNYYRFIWDFLTLPVFITDVLFLKFYRVLSFKNKVFKTRKFKIIQKSLKYLFISRLLFFFFKDWLFIFIVLQIPSKFKSLRRAYSPKNSSKLLYTNISYLFKKYSNSLLL